MAVVPVTEVGTSAPQPLNAYEYCLFEVLGTASIVATVVLSRFLNVRESVEVSIVAPYGTFTV